MSLGDYFGHVWTCFNNYYIIILMLVLVFVFALFVYSGLFYKIEITVGSPKVTDFVAFYKYRIGPYKNCSNLFKELKNIAPECESFGIFYDDPRTVEADNQKYAIGAAFRTSFLKKPETETIQEILATGGWKKYWFPKPERAITVEFPYKNRLSLFIAMHRVYPRLQRYLEENKLSVKSMMEYYTENRIYFHVPLDNMESFLVPENI